jgi:hypothetical protein
MMMQTADFRDGDHLSDPAWHDRAGVGQSCRAKDAAGALVIVDIRCRLDQDHRLQTARITIGSARPRAGGRSQQPGSTRPLATKNVQLMAQREVL